jgi:Flp pilus assembly protein TadG
MRRRGQSLVESTLVLLVFFAMLLGVIDCGQVLYAHQALEERVRSAVRWGAMHPFDGTGEQVASLILYNQTDQAGSAAPGYLGLTRANIQVRHQASTAEQPDDERISVAIVNYQSHFFSPWIARTIVSPRPVFISEPMSYHTVAIR